MAGFVAAPNTIKVLLHWNYSTRPQLNVLHGMYTASGPLSPNIAETIFAAAKANWNAAGNYGSLCGSQMVFTGVGVIDLRSAANPEIPSTSAASPGTGTSSLLPPQNSIVVTERTALTGRSHRGRVYLFGWDTFQVNQDGTIADTAAAAAKSFVDAVNTAMTAQGAPLAILSPALPERPAHDGTMLPAKPFEITPVTSTVVRDRIWDTNRRRTDTIKR